MSSVVIDRIVDLEKLTDELEQRLDEQTQQLDTSVLVDRIDDLEKLVAELEQRLDEQSQQLDTMSKSVSEIDDELGEVSSRLGPEIVDEQLTTASYLPYTIIGGNSGGNGSYTVQGFGVPAASPFNVPSFYFDGSECATSIIHTTHTPLPCDVSSVVTASVTKPDKPLPDWWTWLVGK